MQTTKDEDEENRPLDKMAVLQKIEAIEKTVGSIKGRISELEAKKKSLDEEEDVVLLQLESSIGRKRKSHKKAKKASKKTKKVHVEKK